jgi:hypothetical protein
VGTDSLSVGADACSEHSTDRMREEHGNSGVAISHRMNDDLVIKDRDAKAYQ